LVARPKKVLGPHIYWRKGTRKYLEYTPGARAYADLRAYAEVGGGREALSERGSSWGTTDPDLALVLFEARVTDLKETRKGRAGLPQQKTTTLQELVRHHLIMKAQVGRTSDSHLFDLESRLRAAIAFFGRERDPRTIVPNEVRAWSEALAKDGTRKPGTIRHYLNALSGLYRRAQEGLHVAPGYNPVAALNEKPTGRWKGEAAFFEVSEGALILEAARVLQARDRKNSALGLHAILGTFLLTGGRKSEVLGLDVDDVSFDRGLVRFRPNAHRGLKTHTSVRTVPLWPQLREILQEWILAKESPRVSGLLFPSPTGGAIGNLRRSLDAIAELCGMEAGEIRTRAFRHTYCSARLQTVQRIRSETRVRRCAGLRSVPHASMGSAGLA